MRNGKVAAVAGLVLLGCAGPQRPWGDRVHCRAEAVERMPEPGDDAWLALLLRGFDPQDRMVTHPAVDCTGAQVRWEVPAFQCADSAVARTALPHRPLAAADLIVTALDERLAIAWVITDRFGSGDALGPVAVVEQRGRELLVRAVGHLRAYPTRTRLRLERVGALPVLVAEGERCASADPATCERAARLMPLAGDRFVPLAIASDDGHCLSASLLHLTRTESEHLDSGWQRQFGLTASMTFGPEGLAVQELLVVRDRDPRQPANPPRLFRRAESAYTIRSSDGRLVGSDSSLWVRMRNVR